MTPEKWLREYKGNFPFYLDLKRQVMIGRTLSPRQSEAVERAIQREAAPPQCAESFSIKPGAVLVVGKFIAQRIAAENGLTRPHHAFEVLKVHRETERAYQVTAKLSAQRTSHCGICGLSLTNPESVAAGIGPICAERWDIPYGSESLEHLAEKLSEEREVTAWIAKRSIKNLGGASDANADE